jgi:DNA polymerase III alpha subunit
MNASAAAALEASALAAPLRVHSTGSLLRGTVAPDALAGEAAALGYRALGLADRDGLYAAAAFARACGGAGSNRARRRALGRPGRQGAGRAAHRSAAAALWFARDRAGYASLCRLLTARHLEPDVPWDEACARAARVSSWSRSAWTRSPHWRRAASNARALRSGSPRPATTARRCATRSPPWRGLRPVRAWWRPGASAGCARRRAMTSARACSRRCGRTRWSSACRRSTGRCAGAGRARRGVARGGARAAAALAANAALVARCQGAPELGVPRFPTAPVPEGETPYSHLYARCHEGLARRYRPVTRAAVHRLARELEVIDRLGFTPYFVLVADIVGFARAQGIPSVGRGSGAASIVSYVLGITNVDPLRYRLAFERFLHDERRDCPDLDIDLCWIRRDDVIAHVYRTYGAERVAMISTHCTLGARGAFREAAQAHGIPPDVVDKIAKFVPHEPEGPLADLLARPAARMGLDLAEPSFADALRDAPALVGLSDHLGVHPCGLVIADNEADGLHAARGSDEGPRGLADGDAADRSPRPGQDGPARQPR